MIHFILDLDFTLYSENDIDTTNTTLFYDSFKEKKFLNKLLNTLKKYGKLYIFSNGNNEHVEYVIQKMNLNNIFTNTSNSDEYNNLLKPTTYPYKYVINKFNINKDDLVIFFEDTLENLKTAKKYNWITVYIDNNVVNKYNYVDFIFPTIEKALLFFNNYPIYKYLNNIKCINN